MDNDRTYYADRLKFSLPDCAVLEAKDGRSGLELYKSRKIDCIITELNLPDMPGFEALLKVIQRPSHPDIAVIILTRAALRPLTDIALRNGAQAFLVKPWTAGGELVEAIQRAIATVGPTWKDRDQAACQMPPT